MSRERIRTYLKQTPLVGPLAKLALRVYRRITFPGSGRYWEGRYAGGGTSGAGSYDEQGRGKAALLNRFVKEHHIRSVIEFGSGDGAQLALAEYPEYLGLDVSRTAIELCRERFRDDPAKRFFIQDGSLNLSGDPNFRAELALSLDVVYHLIEDPVFERYMRQLFGAAERFVIIYSTDEETGSRAPHVRHRAFSRWVEENIPGWRLTEKLSGEGPPPPDGPPVGFFVYGKA